MPIANNTFIISRKPNLSLDLMAAYKSESTPFLFHDSSLWTIDAGLKWQFCKNRAVLSFKASDIFESMMPRRSKRMPLQSQWQNYDYRFLSRNISVSFTYKFHNFKEKETNDVDVSRFGVKML